MAGYIGKVQITGNDAVLIGSTLYGICTTSASSVTKAIDSTSDNTGKFINNNITTDPLQGTTIHVKFTQGNSVTSGMYLKVGTTLQNYPVTGNCVCDAGTIISFTLDENSQWVVNDNVDNDTQYTFSEGSTSGAFSVSVNGANPTSVTIHGLGSAAYQNVSTAISNNSGETEIVGAAAIYQYVQDQTGGLAGLTGSMHFRGTTTTDLTDTANTTTNTVIINSTTFTAIEGDVVILNEQEYVWTGTEWILLGDEGSYALKSSTGSVINTVTFTANTTPSIDITTVTASKVTITSGAAASLETTAVSVPNVVRAGTPTTATVSAGVLIISSGTSTTLGTAISITAVESFTANTPTVVSATDVGIGSASNWSAGTAASFSSTTTSVVVPS